jgi:hypothetical protein
MMTHANVARVIKGIIRQVRWQPVVEHYLIALARATRQLPAIELGVSTRHPGAAPCQTCSHGSNVGADPPIDRCSISYV